MDLRSKIGQLIMIGFEGTALTDSIKDRLKRNRFGGAILFSRNYSDKGQLKELCAGLQDINAATGDSSPPLFIGVDQEGGRVRRLGPPFIESPRNRAWGDANDPDKTYLNARAVALELKGVGINVNFAPVLDIDTNPDNPVIGDRSYGSAPELVSRHALAAIAGFSEGGVLPVGKHFPGHGDTSLDSHLDLPLVDLSQERLRQVELIPFVNAIKGGLEMLMTAHVLYKALDPERPATFSHNIITRLLREEMGFNGVIFTDDMEMGAVSGQYEFSEACLLALGAGADILLICHDARKQETAFNAIYGAVKSGTIKETRIDESVDRIIRLKRRIIKS